MVEDNTRNRRPRSYALSRPRSVPCDLRQHRTSGLADIHDNTARDEEVDRRECGLLFNFSTSNIYSFGFAAVALGIARQMIDDAIKVASEKTPAGSRRALRDNNVSRLSACTKR